ncbi:MAG: glycosyltransferase family 39 protein [Myxococcales bacterium]|nr:glycosyltransferase family 39 protein [Myxococcales bacterium]MCB9713271.1 glycosyltransferase family 39 protein [Myxococcales bacterium]
MSPPSSSSRPAWARAAHAALAWIHQERWLLLVLAGALIVRLHWNLHVHPPGDYVYSDMNGYVSRANRMLEHGLAPHEYSSFFPYGTHWIVAGMKMLFGKDDYDAIAVLLAVIGALTVAFAYASARRASAFPWVAPMVGLLGIFYYPHFSLGGYILSEVPFSFFVMGAVLFSLRLADEGRHRDAWGMGIFAALGTVIRPQILVSAALLGVFWLVRRKALPKIRFVHLLQSFVPVVAILIASSALLRHNTGRTGLVSENGSFNLVFGRCHNSKILSTPDGKGHGRVHFRPPSFLQVRNHEARAAKRGIPPQIALEPAIEDELSYPGYIGDKEKHMEFVRECVRRTGIMGQLRYSVVNATLLWRHNVPWPDSGRSQWRPISAWWTKRHRELLAVPALIGLVFLGLGRRTIKQALLAIHLLAMVLVAAVFFGSIRIRTPYDFVIMTLAFEVYSFGVVLLWKGGRWLWQRRKAKPGPPPPAAH